MVPGWMWICSLLLGPIFLRFALLMLSLMMFLSFCWICRLLCLSLFLLRWYPCLPKLCIITLHKLCNVCIIIMQMHNPSHFCIITISSFLALGAQLEIANVLPKRCASRRRPQLPDYAEIVQKDYAKFMQEDYAKFMQEDNAMFMQEDWAKFMQENFAKSKHSKSVKLKNCKGRAINLFFRGYFEGCRWAPFTSYTRGA